MVDVYDREDEAQYGVREIAAMLLFLTERLTEIGEGIWIDPPGSEAMYDGKEPYSVAVDLKGAIECSVSDDLHPAVKRLRKAARATEDSLRREFEERAVK